MRDIHLIVPTVPVAQPRQRHRIVVRGKRVYAQNYTPATHPANACKAAIQQAFAAAYSGAPLDGPVYIRLVCVFPRPKSMRWKRRPMPRDWYPKSKADADNVLKLVLDALNGLAWHDDGQVAAACVYRVIAAGDEQPHLEIAVGHCSSVVPDALARICASC